MQDIIILGYWAIRGRAQVSRLLLQYTGFNWQSKIYKNPQQWFQKGDKLTLQLGFPNLPYMIRHHQTNTIKLTESIAIQKYIIKISSKPQLLGKTTQDQAYVQMILSMLDEIFNPVFSIFYSSNHQSLKGGLYTHKIKPKLQYLAKWIGDKQFLMGYLTLLDFKLSQYSYYLQKLYPNQYESFPFLNNIRKTINGIPAVQKYYEKQKSIRAPFLPSYAALKF